MTDKKLHETITTMGDFRIATKDLSNEIQIYVDADTSGYQALMEITEIMLELPKTEGQKPTLILQAR